MKVFLAEMRPRKIVYHLGKSKKKIRKHIGVSGVQCISWHTGILI